MSSQVDRSRPAGWLRRALRVGCLLVPVTVAAAAAPPNGNDATTADAFSGLWTDAPPASGSVAPDAREGFSLLVLHGHAESLVGLRIDTRRVRPVAIARSATQGIFEMSWSQFDSRVHVCARRVGDRLQTWQGVASGPGPLPRGGPDCSVPPAPEALAEWTTLPAAQRADEHTIAASAWDVRISEAISDRGTVPADVEPGVPTLRFEATRVRNVIRGVLTTSQGPVDYEGVIYGDRFRLQGVTTGHVSNVITGQVAADRAEAVLLTPRPGTTFGIFQQRRAVRGVRVPGAVTVRPFPVATGRWALRMRAAAPGTPLAELHLHQAGPWVVGRFRDARREWVVSGRHDEAHDDRLTLRANGAPVTLMLRVGVDALEGELVHADRAPEAFTATLRAE